METSNYVFPISAMLIILCKFDPQSQIQSTEEYKLVGLFMTIMCYNYDMSR